MTLSNSSLVNRFVSGGDSGSSSRMEIREVNGVRCLVGYGWAVYAAELPDGGFALFGDGYATDGTDLGWAGYSSTTTKHMQIIKRAFERSGVSFAVVDSRIKCSYRNGGDVRLRDIDDLSTFAFENAAHTTRRPFADLVDRTA